MLYGPYAQHPWREDMFSRPDMLQKDFEAYGFTLDIAMVTQSPAPGDRPPDVRIARSPLYDQKTGELKEAHFRPGSIANYPGVIDHWVHNFQDEVLQVDGTFQRTAHGIGLPAERVWNHKSIQAYGNHKDKMNSLIERHNVGLTTYRAKDFERYADKYGGSAPLIYKPQGGSLGLGIHVFPTIGELKSALRRGIIAPNGLIQLYIKNNRPIQGVVPATREDDRLLKVYNVQDDRPREIRMHVITTTNDQGELCTEAYPMMKISQPHRQTLIYERGIGIDPACLGPGTFIHDKSVELAQALCREAGENGVPIPQYYGVFDWLVDGDVHNPEDVRVGDGNCRGPGLPVCASAARQAFVRAIVSSAKKQMSYVIPGPRHSRV